MAGKVTVLLLFVLFALFALMGSRSAGNGVERGVQQAAAQQPPNVSVPAEQGGPIDDLTHGFDAMRCGMVNSSLCGGETFKYREQCDRNTAYRCDGK